MQRPQIDPKIQKISYCKGVIDPNNISPEVEDVLDRLEDGEHAGLCIEKLRGHNLFSCRLSDSDRLLFTYIEHNDAQYLLLLDIVINHDYAKSFATKRRALSNFIQLNGQVFQHSIVRNDFEPVAETAANTNIINVKNDNNKPKRKRVYIEREYFNYDFITLSHDQTKARKVTLPATVSGVAGGGKSGAAFARITDLAEAMSKEDGDQLPDVCYVTQSKPLCENMQENFEATRRADLVEQGRICFKTYEELINANLQHVDDSQFAEFMVDEIKSHQVRCKLAQSSKKTVKVQSAVEQDKLFSKDFYQNVQAMYQEMRVISGTASASDYLKLGHNQSLFNRESQRAERVWLYTIYQKYLKYLASDKNKLPMIDLGCCPVPVEPVNMICIVDEAQDLSPIQLKTLERLANGNILYFYHKDQSLSDPLGKDHCLNEITDARHHKSEPIELKSSFRCGVTALAAGQVFLDLCATLNHEAKSDMPASEITDHPGTLRVITQLSKVEERELQQLAASPDCVIITDEKYIEKVSRRFALARLVVTVDQFKGLEASIVMMVDLLDNEVYARACEQLSLFEERESSLTTKV